MAYLAEYVLWQAQSAVAVNLLIQPVSDLQDPSGCEQLIDASEVVLDSLKEHAVINASEQVGREISKRTVGPVHILQNSFSIVGRSNVQILLHFLIPE